MVGGSDKSRVDLRPRLAARAGNMRVPRARPVRLGPASAGQNPVWVPWLPGALFSLSHLESRQQ